MARKTKTSPRPPRRRRTRRLTALIATVVCAAVAGGVVAYQTVSDQAPERPVTTEEAGRLALSRLNLYQASPVGVVLTADEGGGVRILVEGVVDYRTHRGVGRYRSTGASGSLDHGLVVWDTGGLGLAPEPAGDQRPPWEQAEHIPRSGWSPRSYTADPLDAGLQLLTQVGADRPDNPLLLAQSGARWLGRDRIDGGGYDRFAGPRAQGAAPDGKSSPLTYWVDGDGNLRRVTMRMAGLGTPTSVDFSGRDADAKLPEAPWLTG
ncbi:hypothetical protein [Kitasatospora cathayae]|uniref:DUF2092 domain-containing protein n=1 Tax=Kitasatospora cathayae TaxID=3004092 RepID=A0ABY7QET7_9ACTN|nr:hypothetical protein [Kitasatospora sp. HUAS 3-15]WBP90759.1 hypothetical protein O1G21_36110 [Kitasatospora sp. HUAS 3-15]